MKSLMARAKPRMARPGSSKTAPGVSICGGEPTIYPELPELIEGIIARNRHIYLCTNALLNDEKLPFASKVFRERSDADSWISAQGDS